MRVKIGPYKNWIGPYQIADALFFWNDPNKDNRWSDLSYRLGDWLAHGTTKGDTDHKTWLYKLLEWIQSKRERQLYVHIDDYDVWNLHNTASLILLPMFRKLRNMKQGAPHIDDDDVPPEFRSTAPGARDTCLESWDIDKYHFDRYNWVLDEIIWAFEQDVDDAAKDQFFTQLSETTWPYPPHDVEASLRNIKFDMEGMDAWQTRKSNAHRLFGKYYETFWD